MRAGGAARPRSRPDMITRAPVSTGGRASRRSASCSTGTRRASARHGEFRGIPPGGRGLGVPGGGRRPPTMVSPGEPRQLVSGLAISFCDSSWMSTATFASAAACSRPWCAQKSSSPEFGSRTRTYAWAPQRSHRSRAVSGFVGARAPVNVAFLFSVPSARGRRLRLSCLLLTAEHNTWPGVSLPWAGVCTPQAKTALDHLDEPMLGQAPAGRRRYPVTTPPFGLVTGDLPVRLLVFYPGPGNTTHLRASCRWSWR
jgi:hypothetical protein